MQVVNRDLVASEVTPIRYKAALNLQSNLQAQRRSLFEESRAVSDYADEISLSLVTDGGHLAVGRGGFCLHYKYYRLLGNDSDAIKRAAVNAGLPIIDSRGMPSEIAACLAISGPLVAVNRVSGNAWQTLFEAPLAI